MTMAGGGGGLSDSLFRSVAELFIAKLTPTRLATTTIMPRIQTKRFMVGSLKPARSIARADVGRRGHGVVPGRITSIGRDGASDVGGYDTDFGGDTQGGSDKRNRPRPLLYVSRL